MVKDYNENFVQEYLKALPSVDRVQNHIKSKRLPFPDRLLTSYIREVLDEKRKSILSPSTPSMNVSFPDLDLISREVEERVTNFMKPSLTRVVNATGVVIHTNLGRSPLPDDALRHIENIAKGFSNLEYDTKAGERGSRYSHIEDILCELTGAEAAIVVNNNAGGVLLALNTTSSGKEVIVSRGELIEIGGSFRMPDVMSASGATLVEVGTTNKTHLHDYERAIGERTSLIFKVHTSNYKIVGFTDSVALTDLVKLARKYSLLVMEDLGSGCLIDLAYYGIGNEPSVQEIVRKGVDLVTFSGDKLLGGPQTGIILGKREIVDKIKRNPINRALRIDKLTLAALETTLRYYLDEDKAVEQIPTLKMILVKEEELHKRAKKLLRVLAPLRSDSIEIAMSKTFSEIGGGALPLQKLPTRAISIHTTHSSVNDLEKAMRHFHIPVIGRIEKGRYLLDLRTIRDDEFVIIKDALKGWTMNVEN